MKRIALFVLALAPLAACGGPGAVGDECEVADDCEEGLECVVAEGDDVGTCEEPAADDTDA